MQGLRVAVIGAGTAGLAAAALLQSNGNKVTVFERFKEPMPVGAGLLIQPTGLAVLAQLGLDRQVIAAGSRIDRLYGKVAHRDSVTLHVQYKDYTPHLFGVGTHRGNLFSALYQKALATGVQIIPDTEIQDRESLGGYDLIVDGSGTNSALRDRYAYVKKNVAYPYGAVWSIVEVGAPFQLNTLEQRYLDAKHMIGVLPVGVSEVNGKQLAAFFWSLPTERYADWKAQPFEQWQQYVASLWPDTASLVEQFSMHDDLMFASYRDVVLHSFHRDNMVFIGDSAHCTSPQLGQGANLALVDALILSNIVAAADTVEQALLRYDRERRSHVQFYQMASRYLTPFFQSDSKVWAKLRYLTCDVPCKIPVTRYVAAQVLTGVKTGLWSHLDPGEWGEDYSLK